MATNDLMTELQKDSIKLDDDSERKVGSHRPISPTQCVIAHSIDVLIDVLIGRW